MLEKRFEALALAKTAAAHRLLEWSRRLGAGDRRTAAPALATIPVVDARYRRGARVARLPERWERW